MNNYTQFEQHDKLSIPKNGRKVTRVQRKQNGLVATELALALGKLGRYTGRPTLDKEVQPRATCTE